MDVSLWRRGKFASSVFDRINGFAVRYSEFTTFVRVPSPLMALVLFF